MDIKNLVKESISKSNIFRKYQMVDYSQIKNRFSEEDLSLEASKLGVIVKHGEILKCDSIKELIKTPPNMALADAVGNGQLNADGVNIRILKGDTLCMTYSNYINTYKNQHTKKRHLKPHKKKFKLFFKRYTGQDLNKKRLLIWRTGGIGDIMFSQPIVMYLKKKYNCRIDYATSPPIMSLFDCWPKGLITKVIPMPFPKKHLIKSNYHLSFEGAIERCTQAETVNAYDIFNQVANLDIDPHKYPIKLTPPKDVVEKIRKDVPDNMILIQMRSSSAIRSMEAKRWIEIMNGLKDMGYTVGIIDNYRMSYVYEKIKEANKIEHVINMAPLSKNLTDGIAIMSLCKGLIGIDSSFTHLSAALNKPTFGIYGPFPGHIRMKYYKNVDWYDTEGYEECGKYPCFYHQEELSKCPFVSKRLPSGCLSSVDTTKVLEKFQNLLREVENNHGEKN